MSSCTAAMLFAVTLPFGAQAASLAKEVATVGTACPSQNAKHFIESYMQNAEVRSAYTRQPLHYSRIDREARPEPATVTEQLNEIPQSYINAMSSPELASRIKNISRKYVVLVRTKADTDYQIEYHFRRTSGCWQLYKVSDQSL